LLDAAGKSAGEAELSLKESSASELSSGELVEGGLRHGWMASLAGAAGTPAVVRRDALAALHGRSLVQAGTPAVVRRDALAALHGRSLVQAQCEAAHGADTGPLTRSKAEQNQAGRQPAWGKVLRGCLVCFNSTSIRSFLKL